MIVRFFKAGISNGESPVCYLLSPRDHTGEVREVLPEVLEGLPNTTVQIINGISRRHKYVSGVIAFRQEEQPTREQLFQVIDRFKAVAAPLDPEQFHSFWVLHKDKGNTELHFVFPMLLLSGTDAKGRDLTGKAMNIRPPGSRSEELFDRFQQVMNHELGYAQIVANPLAVRLAHFWHKPAGQVPKQKVDTLQRTMLKGIRRGKIGNRGELCDYLQEELGLTLTRQGEDFISVKFPGGKKAIRLKGSLFEAGADYSRLLNEHNTIEQRKSLSHDDYQQALQRLNQLVQERAEFMRGEYVSQKKTISTTTRRRHEQSNTRRRRNPAQRGGQFSNSANCIAGANRSPAQRGPTIRTGDHSRPMHGNRQAQKPDCGTFGSPNSPGKSGEIGVGRRGIAVAAQELRQKIGQPLSLGGGAVQGVSKSLSGLQVQIIEAIADLTNAKTPEEKAKAECRLAELKAQEAKIQFELIEARRAELNQIEFSAASQRKPRPK